MSVAFQAELGLIDQVKLLVFNGVEQHGDHSGLSLALPVHVIVVYAQRVIIGGLLQGNAHFFDQFVRVDRIERKADDAAADQQDDMHPVHRVGLKCFFQILLADLIGGIHTRIRQQHGKLIGIN